eukprot:gene15254-biopygen11382
MFGVNLTDILTRFANNCTAALQGVHFYFPPIVGIPSSDLPPFLGPSASRSPVRMHARFLYRNPGTGAQGTSRLHRRLPPPHPCVTELAILVVREGEEREFGVRALVHLPVVVVARVASTCKVRMMIERIPGKIRTGLVSRGPRNQGKDRGSFKRDSGIDRFNSGSDPRNRPSALAAGGCETT